jgi:hypothetical protein
MGITSGLVGLGGSLAGMFGGGGAGSVPLPQNFAAPWMGEAAGGAASGIQGLSPYTNLASSTIPYGQQTFQNLYNNPYAGGAQSGANMASGMGQNAAVGAYGTGQQFMGAGLSTIPYAQQLATTGFDPQNALYNRTVQQLQDQTRAGLEARGIDNTPYGAGVEGQTMGNFNIDWQNNELQRQLQAAQGAGSLLGQGANVAGFGTGLQAQAPGQFATASAMPYATAAGIGGGQNQAINSLLGIGSSGQSIAQQPIQDWMSFLNAGNQQQNQIAGLGLEQNQLGFNQNQILGQGLGRSLYGLGQGWGGNYTGSPVWGGAFGGGSNLNPYGNLAPGQSAWG